MSQEPISYAPQSVCGVLVLFAPLENPINHLEQRLSQLTHLAVIDNGDDPERHAQLKAWTNSKVTYVVNSENNLAKAQNIGIAIARARGDEFVLLLDDDSTMSDGMVEKLVKSSSPSPIGLVAPQMIDAQTRIARDFIESWAHILFRKAAPDADGICNNVMTVIASGSLIPLAVLADVGGMDESYGIDYIDKEFCLRLRQHGYRIVADTNAKLLHTIGNSEDKFIAGFRMVATNHSPARRFTIYRNRIRTLRRYGLREPSFATHELLGMGYDWLRIGLFEKDKKAKAKAIWNGMKAGFSSSQ